VAGAAARLGLRHVVITSVTRDDLIDGGAGHFARTIRAVRDRLPAVGVEVLTPDFGGAADLVAVVVDAAPTVFNHNVETCERLTPQIRSGADYRRSLRVLRLAGARAAEQDLALSIKSGFMLGLGETEPEIRRLLTDLRANGVDMLTIGQYLAPSTAHHPVVRFVTPNEFDDWATTAREQFGFPVVSSGPLVRSSYMAEDAADRHGRTDDSTIDGARNDDGERGPEMSTPELPVQPGESSDQ